MTIKKRLFWSNIFMIAVPVISTVLIGCVCVGLIWLSLIGGMGLGIQDQEDFDHACMAISEMLEYDIDRDAGFSFVKPLLDSNRMALKIVAEGETLFEYGTKEDGDAARQEDIDKIRVLGLGAGKPPAEIVLGGIRLNTGTHRVFVEEQEVKLKNKEYELLLFLMLNVDLVFDREKLEKDPANPRYIETVWGAGYRFRG